MAHSTVSTETTNHVIEVSEGCLTIGTNHFPDDCISLSLEETDAALELLLIARHGLVAVESDDEEDA